MKRGLLIIISSITVILSVLVSCGKELVTVPASTSSLPNPPAPTSGSIGNGNQSGAYTYYFNYPADSLTGREFIFNNLNWGLDGIFTVCDINRPDLFYLPDRPLQVSISINGSAWVYMIMCPYPSDLFYFAPLPGTLRIYVYNYSGSLPEAATSVKVRFL